MTLKENPRSEMGFSDSPANQQSEDVEVDITECGNNQRDEFQSEEEEEDLYQSSSSSFGDSMCDEDSGFEAQSMLSLDYPFPETFGGGSGSDGTDFLGLRKKKLTDDWRKFCQPLMWRCKWLELKVKEIESQANKYEREVRKYYENKQFVLEKSKFEGLDGKSIPFRDDQTQRMNVFKRGRRRRVEDTTDVAAFMPNHNVFSYSEKRKPTALRAQCPDPDFGTGRKATGKEDETEEDCLVSELDCSEDYLAKILCKIDEAQERAKRLRKRIDQLVPETVPLLPPPTMARSRSDLTVQVGKQDEALVEEPLMVAQATVQIGRQRISADNTEDVVMLLPQAPSSQIDGQCLNNISPLPGCFRSHQLLEDLFMDEPEMEGDETEMGEEKLDLFKKLMDSFADPSEEADEEEEDPTPVTKKQKTSK
ncbi:unnamed protein product [Microthlaspi erraticum]|uniref:Uncharacterized protein n=1 Tax=Microthlaspi erraticum TaxID=1685480 RepID=A0A6D2KRY1_9BRAS|nr:unnamed protein product [Microthlaspi erraticum]